MFTSVLLIIAGLVLLPLGAEGVVRGGSRLALRVGVTPLVIGLTVVAFGTSSPELAVSAEAALKGGSGIALGNVVGSNIGNICLVLGAAALVRPMKVRLELVRREMPVMIGVSLLLILMLADGRIGRLEGVLLVLGLVAYTVVSYRLARQVADPDSAAEFAEALPVAPGRAFAAVAMIVAGLAALLAGANLLIQGAVAIASALGVSPAVIGLSVVAIGTSLPELATSVMAAARDEPDVAFGNVVGSNIFNILMVVGLAAVIQPLQTDGVRAVDLAVMLAVAVVALPMMRRDWRLSRIEGALLLAGYGVYLATLTR
jgi:cation:H+ antiporter